MTTTISTPTANAIIAAVEALNALPAAYLAESGPCTVIFETDDHDATYEGVDAADALATAWQQSDQFGSCDLTVDTAWGQLHGWVSVGGWMTGHEITVTLDGLDEFVTEAVACLSDWAS
jgi:hypothetical protein